MGSEDKPKDLERITELIQIINGIVYTSSSSSTIKLFAENDIYHRSPQEVTILDSIQKHKYSFFKRIKAKIELYDIYYKSRDEVMKKEIIKSIDHPSIFYVICNSVMGS